ncbi:glycosyltransferase family 2 protein [Paraglaciecola sp.]|uniref:glycosyltransferase family 2 protein n=1 Tax=Paraglaciecola sp. TaxID=1920173 RepID=UPI003EF0F8B7
MNTSILVVLYAQNISQSDTIKGLILHALNYTNTSLVIWNNGPDSIPLSTVQPLKELGFKNVELVQTIENIALSKIYNRFIKNWPAKRYILLDHDSFLTQEYLSAALSDREIEVGVPLIESQQEIRSPHIEGKWHPGPYTNKDKVRAIGSGLIISENICQIIKNSFGDVFDQRFYLYGVDTTFFYRLRKVKLNSRIKIISKFNHSLSRLENESEETKFFRRKERSYEIGLKTRYYLTEVPRLFISLIIRRCLGLDSLSVRYLFHALISGKHYRDKE